MKNFSIFFLTCILISITSCSGIKLSDNCGKQTSKTFIVLPFVEDDYACSFDIENKIRNLCYNVENGLNILNEYSRSINKSFSEISIDEFCDYAKTKGIDYVVIGNARVEWFEGTKSPHIIEPGPINLYNSSGGTATSKSLDARMYLLVTGNYAVVDGYHINTTTKERKEIFRNYKVKKVSTGMPSPF